MSTSNYQKRKKNKGPLMITKKVSKKNGSLDIIFTVINHASYFREPKGCRDTLGTVQYRMQLNKQ